MTMTRELAEQHYAEHEGKPFFGELVEFITSGPLVAMVLEGGHAIEAARQVIGATNPLQATTGSIRGDYALAVGQNMVHGSDAPESAAREVGCSSRALTPGPGDRVSPGLVLASRSPQRRAILEQLGVAFEVVVPAGWRSSRRDRRTRSRSRTPTGRRRPWPGRATDRAAGSCSGSTPSWRSGRGCTASRPSRETPRTRCARCRAAPTRSSAASA